MKRRTKREKMAPYVVALFSYRSLKPIFIGFDSKRDAKGFMKEATQHGAEVHLYTKGGV